MYGANSELRTTLPQHYSMHRVQGFSWDSELKVTQQKSTTKRTTKTLNDVEAMTLLVIMFIYPIDTVIRAA